MKFRDCTSMKSARNIKEGYRFGLSKTALEIESCKQQLFTLKRCLSACLWGQIVRISFNYTITTQPPLAKCNDYQSRRLILEFPALEKNYRITSIIIITWAVLVRLEMLSKEKVASCLVRQTISWSSNESSRKHENIALKSTTTKQWNSLIPLWHYLHFTFGFVCITNLRSVI